MSIENSDSIVDDMKLGTVSQYLILFIEAELIYNVLVSGVQQSESVIFIYIYIYTLIICFSIVGYYKIISCAIQSRPLLSSLCI